jgi:hypothetical protein
MEAYMLARKLLLALLAGLLAATPALAAEEPVSEDVIASGPEGEKQETGGTVESDS